MIKHRIEYNERGGRRYIITEPLPVGQCFMHFGARVRVVGPGLAGLIEVEDVESKSGFFASPEHLEPIEKASQGE